jgi:hypothetical protein
MWLSFPIWFSRHKKAQISFLDGLTKTVVCVNDFPFRLADIVNWQARKTTMLLPETTTLDLFNEEIKLEFRSEK